MKNLEKFLKAEGIIPLKIKVEGEKIITCKACDCETGIEYQVQVDESQAGLLLYYGFKNYGFKKLKDQIKNDSIELVEKVGFYEYFDPRKEIYDKDSKGYGGNNFSWTAALIIDLLNEK